jgi:hypothetical protein
MIVLPGRDALIVQTLSQSRGHATTLLALDLAGSDDDDIRPAATGASGLPPSVFARMKAHSQQIRCSESFFHRTIQHASHRLRHCYEKAGWIPKPVALSVA